VAGPSPPHATTMHAASAVARMLEMRMVYSFRLSLRGGQAADASASRKA
jgi:hypothetical protein